MQERLEEILKLQISGILRKISEESNSLNNSNIK